METQEVKTKKVLYWEDIEFMFKRANIDDVDVIVTPNFSDQDIGKAQWYYRIMPSMIGKADFVVLKRSDSRVRGYERLSVEREGSVFRKQQIFQTFDEALEVLKYDARDRKRKIELAYDERKVNMESSDIKNIQLDSWFAKDGF